MMGDSDIRLVAAAQAAFFALLDALHKALQAGITVDCNMDLMRKAVTTPGEIPTEPVFTFTKET